MKLRITARALVDIELCLFWSAENFGIPAAHRYRVLLEVALLAIQKDPALPGSKPIKGFDGKVRAYHLRNSRREAQVGGFIVKNPRHLLIFCCTESGSIELLRVLHDHMDVESQMNDD